MDTMSDEELAAAAYVLRKRAELGDAEALKKAKQLESTLKKRLGPTPSGRASLEPETGAGGTRQKRPWWRFW
jgi:hypothetical protein